MARSCVNRGGAGSVLRLPVVPVLEVELALDMSAAAALEAWQARCGEILTAVDPLQDAYRVRLTRRDTTGIACVPFERLPKPVESPLQLRVYQAVPEKERFELVLQKLTEVGVQRIVPMQTERSISMAERDAGQKKSHRWPDVLLRAARQCRRAEVPELAPCLDFAEALQEASAAELALMLYEGETGFGFSEELGRGRFQSVALLIGPEGGFSTAEVTLAAAQGVLPVGLGPRILRTETAAIVAATLVQNRLGDLR